VRARLRIETRSLLRDNGGGGGIGSPSRRPSALQRFASFQARAEAAAGLAPKRERLIARLKAHAKRAAKALEPEVRGAIPCLQVRRQSIGASLRFVSHLPAVALELGKLRIKFVDEPAVDVGGVFREFMAEMARALSTSPLLVAANDGALLPAPGQGALERRAMAGAELVEVLVPLGADGKLGCMLGECTPGGAKGTIFSGAGGDGGGGAGGGSAGGGGGGSNTGGGSGGAAAAGDGGKEGEGGKEGGVVYSILHVEPNYPAAGLLQPGDALLGVNGCRVEGSNTLALIRQAAMAGAPHSFDVCGAGLDEVNGTYERLDGVSRCGGAPVYACGRMRLSRAIVPLGSSGRRHTYVWVLGYDDDHGGETLYQVRKPFVPSVPPTDGWATTTNADAAFGHGLLPPPSLVPGGACTIALTVRRGPVPFNPAWREELYAVGRLMGIAIATDTPLDVPFSSCIYKLLLAEPITARDVARIDRDFARHRVAPLLRPGGVAHMEALLVDQLTFTGVPRHPRPDGSEDEQELEPGGASRRVTEANKGRYLSLLIEHYLVGHCREELALLAAGFHDLIPQHVLRDPAATGTDALRADALRALELELIVAGLPSIDVADWRRHTTWSFTGSLPRHATAAAAAATPTTDDVAATANTAGGDMASASTAADAAADSTAEDSTDGTNDAATPGAASAQEAVRARIEGWLFELLEGLGSDGRATLLSFVCGSGRLPAAGFAGLRPPFSVEINLAEPLDHLPSAHTCFNQLCLPPYDSKALLDARLSAAMQWGGNSFGFA